MATGVENRTKIFLKIYWQDYNLWKGIADKYWIKTEVLVAISYADTHLGLALKGTNNVGNVWSFDRGGTNNYNTLAEWIAAIAYTLNGKYLWEKQTIGDLSYAGDCVIRCDKVYATSNENWQANVLNSLSNIYQERQEPSFTFRK